MNKDYILYVTFLFIISVFNQFHNKYINKTIELFYSENNIEITTVKEEILELLERLESYIKVIVNFKNFNNSRFLNEQTTEIPNEVNNEEKEEIVENFVNYTIEGCNKDYESSWKEEYENFTSREELLNYISTLNLLYDKNISNSIQLKDNLIDMIYSMKKVFTNSTDTNFVNCEQITPNQQQIIDKYCVLNDPSIDLFTKQKIMFAEDINTITNDICSLLVKYNDLHHLVKELRNVNNYYNSLWEDEQHLNKTNIQFKTDD